MASKNYLSGLFGTSPVGSLQSHLKIVDECVARLIGLFEHMPVAEDYSVNSRLGAVGRRKNIPCVSKRPTGLFIPNERQDFLDTLRIKAYWLTVRVI